MCPFEVVQLRLCPVQVVVQLFSISTNKKITNPDLKAKWCLLAFNYIRKEHENNKLNGQILHFCCIVIQ